MFFCPDVIVADCAVAEHAFGVGCIGLCVEPVAFFDRGDAGIGVEGTDAVANDKPEHRACIAFARHGRHFKELVHAGFKPLDEVLEFRAHESGVFGRPHIIGIRVF